TNKRKSSSKTSSPIKKIEFTDIDSATKPLINDGVRSGFTDSFSEAIVPVVCVLTCDLAAVYTVGDTSGWTTGIDYSTWTQGKTFKVGDTLGE
ncbi:hypothetical protein Goshw_017262, partial [Gossypium schwendimanii]|nr:hypothetical protein [Gossypium schwendimanii]